MSFLDRWRGVPLVSRDDLAAAWERLGLGAGDGVVVHTALSAFGRVEDGPVGLIESLIAAVGPHGTILMPTATWRSSYLFTPDQPLPDWAIPYDPATTPPDADMGKVPMAFWRWPGTLRSSHPLMSVTAWGAGAARLTGDHPIDDPLRPYRTMAALGGKILLLGVDHTRNTTVHTAEFDADLPHLSGPGYGLVRDRDTPEGYHLVRIAREPDCSMGFGALNNRVPRQSTQIGGAGAWLVAGQDVLDTAGALLAADRGALLCTNSSCRTCARGRRMYTEARRRVASS
jgi:aminoglycoside 3-N-acetyltransferase